MESRFPSLYISNVDINKLLMKIKAVITVINSLCPTGKIKIKSLDAFISKEYPH